MFYSIVIPLYNKEKEIESTIKSVLNQTHKDFEIIVVDDGSTDLSPEKVNSFKDDRLKLVKKVNGGESSARNFGIKNSKYDYIAFLDSDDLWESNYLEKMEKLIQIFPNCGMYSSLYKYIIDKNMLEPKFPNFGNLEYQLIDNYYKASSNAPIITSSTAIIPKCVFYDIGYFNESISHGPDLEMWLRISYKYKLAICKSYLAYYRLSASNRQCNSVPPYTKSIVSIIEKYDKASKDIYHGRYLNKIRLDFLSQYLDADKKRYFNIIRVKLRVFNLKSLIYKTIPYNLLRYGINLYRNKML